MDPIETIPLPTVHDLGRTSAKKADEKTALKAFDAYFLGEMLRQSRPKNTTGLFDGGQAGRMYQDHLYQEMAKMIAEKGDFGLAASLEGALVDGEKAPPAREPDPNDETPEQDREETP